MEAAIFFRMLSHGRLIEMRRDFRNYYNLCRVNAYPHMNREDQKKIEQHYWDGSLSQVELSRRDERMAQVKADAAKTWVSSKEALRFFKR